MRKQLATFLATFVLGTSPAAADTIAINFNNTAGEPLSNPPMTLGWAFDVNAPIYVTHLSFFDSGQDGLAESHSLGVWTATGALVVSAAVEAGTVNELHDKFRAVEVAPTLLNPGSYRIGALFTTNSDSNMFPTFTAGFSVAPEITFLRTANAVGPTLTMPNPTFFSMGPAYFGPNFEFQSVPEPSSMALGTIAVLAGIVYRRRLTQRTHAE